MTNNNTEFDSLVLDFLSGTVLDTFGEDRIVERLIEAYRLGRSDSERGRPDKINRVTEDYITEVRAKLDEWLETDTPEGN